MLDIRFAVMHNGRQARREIIVKIGVAGLGRMGSAIARRLIDVGHDVIDVEIAEMPRR